jgi:hypothetical protein
MYQGLHGIENYKVCDISTEEEANEIGREMAEGVVEDYCKYLYYGYDDDEEVNSFDNMIEEELYWDIYKIKDIRPLDILNNAANNLGAESFIEDYCYEEVIN